MFRKNSHLMFVILATAAAAAYSPGVRADESQTPPGPIRTEVTLHGVTFDSDGKMTISYQHGGGCAQHDPEILMKLESGPDQTGRKTLKGVTIEKVYDVSDQWDSCEALIYEKRLIDLPSMIVAQAEKEGIDLDRATRPTTMVSVHVFGQDMTREARNCKSLLDDTTQEITEIRSHLASGQNRQAVEQLVKALGALSGVNLDSLSFDQCHNLIAEMNSYAVDALKDLAEPSGDHGQAAGTEQSAAQAQ